MKTKHTQGEWVYNNNGASFNIKVDNEFVRGGNICPYVYGKSLEESQANAKLIAAAPDLLEACINTKNLCDKLQMPTEYDLIELSILLKKVIEKATK